MFIGPMASGKSSIGRLVAEMLGVPFLDTDSEIVQQHGAVADIFARHGEAFFRELEEQTVADALTASEPKIVSLGGGAVLSKATRELLKNHTVVLLMTDEKTVLERANLEKRPLLRDDPSAWTRILNERLPFYQEVATVTFDTARLPKDKTAERIASWLKDEHL